MKHGDFSNLAENYSRYRTGYAPSVLDAFLALSRERERERESALT